MDGSEFVKQIETRLIMSGLTKELFYSESGISTANMSQWRTDKFRPSKKAVAKVEEFFDKYSDKKENPTKTVLGEAIPGYDSLSEENKLKAQEYIALLLNSQQT